jgi:glutamate synthase (NADPH/NADH) small chain
MDCARCARRLGADVVVVYRRRLQDSPARKEEVDHAEEEGIHFATLNTPLEIVANCENTGIKGLRSQINMFIDGEVKPVDGELNFHQCQMVIIAVGQGPNPIVPSSTPGLHTIKGLISTNE